MDRLKTLVLVCLGAGLMACGSEESSDGLSILDPSSEHLGRSYGEWAAEWVKYAHSTSPAADCADPIQDTTGEFCNLFQKPESGVYFLNGTFGGPARRKCVIPADVALFFPLVNNWSDNAGVPAEDLKGDAELRAFSEEQSATVIRESLYVRVDGETVSGVEESMLPRAAPYTLDFPDDQNVYTCNMVEGVVGKFKGYVSGAWAMLPPLPKGKHRLEFGGAAQSAVAGEEGFSLDVTYELTVE